MHERRVVEDLIRQAETICAHHDHNASRIKLTVGVLSGFDPAYVGHYFNLLVSPDSPLAGVDLDIGVSDPTDTERAAVVSLDSMTFAED